MAPGSQNGIFGLDLTGAFSNGIFGLNMERAIVKQTSIAPPDGNGILLSNTNPATSQFVHIEDNTITSAGSIGIHVASLLDNGSSFGQTIIIDDNTVTHSTREGIYVYAVVKGGSFLSQNVTIDPNTVISNGGDGIDVGLFVSNASANQSVAVTDNIVEGNSSTGIYVGAVARISGTITQTALVAGNTVTSNEPLRHLLQRSRQLRLDDFLDGRDHRQHGHRQFIERHLCRHPARRARPMFIRRS